MNDFTIFVDFKLKTERKLKKNVMTMNEIQALNVQ